MPPTKTINLDRHISIYVKTLAQGVNGEETVSNDAKLGGIDWWAAYDTSGGGESIDDDIYNINNDIDFIVRYNDLTKTINENLHYIVYDSKTYGIELIENIGRQEYIKLTATYKDINE